MQKISLMLVTLILLCSFGAISGEGEIKNELLRSKAGVLLQQYDVFTEDNKKYSVRLNEENTDSASYFFGNSILLSAKEKSSKVELYSSIGKGDGRYSRPRSGGFQFKFDNDDQIYQFRGNSYYLRSVYASLDKYSNADFFRKLAEKNFVYVKVDIVGVEHVFKINLKGSNRLLLGAKLINN